MNLCSFYETQLTMIIYQPITPNHIDKTRKKLKSTSVWIALEDSANQNEQNKPKQQESKGLKWKASCSTISHFMCPTLQF